MAVLVVAVGQLQRLGGAVGEHDIEMTPSVAGPAHIVELEHEPLEAPRTALLVLFLLVGLVGHTRGERDARAVGGPDRLADVLLEVGELAWLTAGDGHHVQLSLVAVAPRDKCELRAVGRPPRLGVLRAGGELAWR
jgi:hypothetical protein